MDLQKYAGRYPLIFSVFWLIIFAIYLPASQAGRVGDFPGWVTFLNSVSFIDYINRSESGIASLYQFTQVVTYVFYKIIGANAWGWHLLYVTLHAGNAILLYALFKRLFADAGIPRAATVSFWGVLLYCVCPHISEVIVWEPAFHYLLGFMLMLIVILCAQQFMNTGRTRFAWWGGIVFFLSTWSLEVFYLTPFFVLSLILWYRLALKRAPALVKKALLAFVLAEFIFFAANLAILRIVYHESVAHIGSMPLRAWSVNFSKALKYTFHIVFFGRNFSQEVRRKVYNICESGAALAVFYGSALLVFSYLALRFRSFSLKGKTSALLFLWVFIALGLLLPLWFPDSGLVLLDRYTYLLTAFYYMFVALLLSYIANRYVFLGMAGIYALVNLRFTHKMVAYWQQSGHIVNNLVYTFPNDPAKKVLLLNLPECMDGVQMVGSRDEGEFRMMYNAIMPHKISNPVYDVEAFYIRSPADGAHVTIEDDSTVRVTLNQWGTWWIYYGLGATSYQNTDYRVNMVDQGHMYRLVLKHPASQYLLLYVIGDQWKTADWQKKNVDQY